MTQEEVNKWCCFCFPDLASSSDLVPYLDLPKYHFFRACSVTKETYEKLLLLKAQKMLILDGKDRWMKWKLLFRESGIILTGRIKNRPETHVLELRPWALKIIERKQRPSGPEKLAIVIDNYDFPVVQIPKIRESEK